MIPRSIANVHFGGRFFLIYSRGIFSALKFFASLIIVGASINIPAGKEEVKIVLVQVRGFIYFCRALSQTRRGGRVA